MKGGAVKGETTRKTAHVAQEVRHKERGCEEGMEVPPSGCPLLQLLHPSSPSDCPLPSPPLLWLFYLGYVAMEMCEDMQTSHAVITYVVRTGMGGDRGCGWRGREEFAILHTSSGANKCM